MDLPLFLLLLLTSGKGSLQTEQLWPSERDRYSRWLRILAIFEQVFPRCGRHRISFN